MHLGHIGSSLLKRVMPVDCFFLDLKSFLCHSAIDPTVLINTLINKADVWDLVAIILSFNLRTNWLAININ